MEEKPRFLSRAYSDSSTKMERKRVDMNCANYKIKINFWKCVQISYTRSNSMRDCPTQYCSDDKIKNGKWSCAQYFKDSCGFGFLIQLFVHKIRMRQKTRRRKKNSSKSLYMYNSGVLHENAQNLVRKKAVVSDFWFSHLCTKYGSHNVKEERKNSSKS